MKDLKIGFAAGDRKIAVSVLRHIVSTGVRPAILMLAQDNGAYGKELRELSKTAPTHVLVGRGFTAERNTELLRAASLDYLICIHFPYILPLRVLEAPRFGTINLHPAYLPYNRGWHTPSWAILDRTPYGATLHFVDDGVDTGDIIHQKRLEILESDTADTLYERVLDLEFEVFFEAWPTLLGGTFKRKRQSRKEGSVHKRQELFLPRIQKLELNEVARIDDILRTLRALTTNKVEEAAYFISHGRRFRVRLEICEEMPVTEGKVTARQISRHPQREA